MFRVTLPHLIFLASSETIFMFSQRRKGSFAGIKELYHHINAEYSDKYVWANSVDPD